MSSAVSKIVSLVFVWSIKVCVSFVMCLSPFKWNVLSLLSGACVMCTVSSPYRNVDLIMASYAGMFHAVVEFVFVQQSFICLHTAFALLSLSPSSVVMLMSCVSVAAM